MRNTKKLLALALAFMLVLGMLPVASAQTVHTHGIEEYPEIELGVETVFEIAESGETVYVRYTPAVTAEYTFASSGASSADMIDPEGYLYDSEMNLLAKHEDNAFAGCVNVKKIVFSGDLPTILSAFIDVKADAWYPSGNET